MQFATKEEYEASAQDMMDIMATSEGRDAVIIYIKEPRMKKQLPPNQNVKADPVLISALTERFGAENVKLI